MAASRLGQIKQHLAKPTASLREDQLSSIKHSLELNHADEAARLALSLFLTPPRFRAKPEAQKILQSAIQSSIEVDNQNIIVYEWEPTTKISLTTEPPTILLSHGFGFSVATFVPLIAKLLASNRGYRIVAFDHAAHGASSGTTANLGTIKRAIQKVAEENKPLSAIVAHSVGASASIMALAEQSDLLPPAGKFVLLNPPMQPATLMALFCKANGLPTSLARHMDELLSPSPNEVLRNRLGERLSNLNMLVVNGKEEVIAPLADTKKLMESFPNSCSVKLKMTTGLDHRRILEDENVLKKVLTFLE